MASTGVSGLYKRYEKSNAKNILNRVKEGYRNVLAKIEAVLNPQFAPAMA